MHGHGSRGQQHGDLELKQGSDRGQSDQHGSSSSTTSTTVMLSDEEMARRLHEELNCGPKVVTTRRSAKLPLPENGRSTEIRVKQVCGSQGLCKHAGPFPSLLSRLKCIEHSHPHTYTVNQAPSTSPWFFPPVCPATCPGVRFTTCHCKLRALTRHLNGCSFCLASHVLQPVSAKQVSFLPYVSITHPTPPSLLQFPCPGCPVSCSHIFQYGISNRCCWWQFVRKPQSISSSSSVLFT